MKDEGDALNPEIVGLLACDLTSGALGPAGGAPWRAAAPTGTVTGSVQAVKTSATPKASLGATPPALRLIRPPTPDWGEG